jgi:hypothetical protein
MGRFAVTALVAAALAAGTGCGAEEAAREAVDPVAEAAAKTAAAGGARIDGAIELKLSAGKFEMPMTGVVDFEEKRSRVVVRFPALGAEQRKAGFPMEEIRDGLSIYRTSPPLREETGERWAMVDLEAVADEADLDADALAHWDESDPQSMLRFLEVAGDARPNGHGRVGGVATTRYAEVSAERFVEVVAPDVDAETRRAGAEVVRENWGADAVSLRVWLDEDGLIRREEVDLDMTVAGERIDAVLRMDLKDFGASYDVALPDDGDVEDVTDEWDRYKSLFVG